MATKKKSKKRTKSKRAVGKKLIKKAARKKPAKKKLAKKKAPPKKAAVKAKARAKKTRGAKSASAPAKQARGKSYNVDASAFEPTGKRARSGGQSGDLEGLSDVAGADSESVDELLEEGNAFEAEIVKGVEDAPDADQGEVRTHELLEDDVPGEYDEK